MRGSKAVQLTGPEHSLVSFKSNEMFVSRIIHIQ